MRSIHMPAGPGIRARGRTMTGLICPADVRGFFMPARRQDMIDSILGIFDAIPAWIAALTSVVTAATAITALTPSRSDDVWIDRILRVLNVLAGNVGFNRNADGS